MAAVAQPTSAWLSPSAWKWQFLKDEMAPYPGRMALVTRMVIAATLSMLVTMTFRIPEGAYAAIYAFSISRESPRATVAATKTVAIVFAITAVYELIGAAFFVSDPQLRVLWLVPTFILMFYLLRALTNYNAAIRFGYLVIITTPLWDRHISADAKVEGTLWAVWALTLSTIIAMFVELVYAEFRRGDDLIQPIAERLRSVEDVIRSYADRQPVDETTKKNITHLTIAGMSGLRRNLQRSGYSPQYREQMGAVVALVARMVDLAANLAHLELQIADVGRKRMGTLVQTISDIRGALERGAAPAQVKLNGEEQAQSIVPLLREMETTVSLIPDAFVGSESLLPYASPASIEAPGTTVFRPDALSNSDYLKFALKGGLAASLCYFIYSLVDWHGISTCVTTCFLTASTVIGSSHQKQLLRIAGAIMGGIVLGIGSQVFILPHLDSIAEFTILFLAVTFIAAWFATCSPRLSYFGVQIVVAFYLITLQEFKIQTSLAVARDRVAGILLGLFMMWLVFDQIWGAPAVVEMKKTFISALRLLAQFAREPLATDTRAAIDRSFALRETINSTVSQGRALADGVLLEFGASRAHDLALRDRIRAWQAELRTIFITRTVLWKYRMQLPGFELPKTVALAQSEFDEEVANTLEGMADRFEGKATGSDHSRLEDAFEHLENAVREQGSKDSQQERRIQLETFLKLSRNTEQLLTSLNREI